MARKCEVAVVQKEGIRPDMVERARSKIAEGDYPSNLELDKVVERLVTDLSG